MKKVVSVVLALIMVFACFSIAASAVTTDAVLEITVKPTETSYKKGDIVTFEVIYERSAEIGALGNPISIAFGFDSTVFEAVEDLSAVKDLTQATNSFISVGYPLEGKLTLAFSSAVVRDTTTTADANKKWDKMIMFKTAGDVCEDLYENGAASFAFKLKIKEDASDTGSYVVGIADTAAQSGEVDINEELGDIAGTDASYYGFENPVLFKFNDATVTVEGAAASAIIKSNNKTLVGWGNYDVNKDTCDGKFVDDGNGNASWNVAVEAKFTAEELAAAGHLTFDTKGTCTEIKALEATVKIGESAAITKSTQFIYGAADGTGDYVYRVVITGIDFGAADDVTVTFGGTLADDTAISGETVNFNLATVFAAAQGRGLPAAPTAA